MSRREWEGHWPSCRNVKLVFVRCGTHAGSALFVVIREGYCTWLEGNVLRNALQLCQQLVELNPVAVVIRESAMLSAHNMLLGSTLAS